MEEAQDIETQITCAMRARVKDFKEQADSLTLEGVRRMLEKDMSLEKFGLDAHKRFIKQCLNECFASFEDEIVPNVSKNSTENSEQTIQSEKEETNPCEEPKPQKEVSGPSSGDEENMKESSASLQKKMTEPANEEAQGSKTGSVPNKGTIKSAIKKRASYLRANSEKITLSGVRRLLEEDLKLEKNALDAYKSFINEQVDEVLQSPVEKEIKRKNIKATSNTSSKGSEKVKKRGRSSESSDSNTSLNEDEEADEEEIRPKKVTKKRKVTNTEDSKKRKISSDEVKPASNGRNKPVESEIEKNSDIDEGGNVSDDGSSHSSAEENVKKKRETSTVSYGKHVEHLKSIIKSCGMSVPPSAYKKAKQAPESKREAYLIKELEEILGREGLSANPSEKEIKEVKKKKERAKELEGIDMSNIVSSTRRRSTFNFIMPPKPKVPVESEEDDEDNEEDTDGDDDDDGSGSEDASDEFNEDADDESD